MKPQQSDLEQTARRLRTTCIIVDWIATAAAWLIFNIIRYDIVGSGFTSLRKFLLSPMVLGSQIVFPTAMLVIYWLSGYYNNVVDRSRVRELYLTTLSAGAGTIMVLLVILLNDLTPDLGPDYILLISLFTALLLIVFGAREIITTCFSRRVSKGRITRRAIIIGRTERKLPAGFTKYGEGDLEYALSRQNEADCFILIPDGSGLLATLMPSLGALMPLDKPVYLMPDSASLVERRYTTRDGQHHGGSNRVASIADEPLIDLSRTEMSSSALNFKRLADIIIGTAGLILSIPVIIIVAVVVKLTSPGPMFYRQERVGYHRRPFKIIKIRTMRVDAEEYTGPALTSADDPRVTPPGRFLRKYHFDELPQFINIIRGDMSLVGPRPERRHFVEKIIEEEPFYTLVHQVRPGLTSWGMVKYGYASTVSEMVERMRYDLLYLENVGFAVDMKIILYTFRTIATGKGL